MRATNGPRRVPERRFLGFEARTGISLVEMVWAIGDVSRSDCVCDDRVRHPRFDVVVASQ